MSETLYRAARGTLFVPVGAVGGSLFWLAIAGLISIFRSGLETQSLGDALLAAVGTVAMMSITSAFLSFLFALFVGVPLLTILIHTNLDHWIVCAVAGAACAAVLAGSPEHWGGGEAIVIFAGSASGLAAWFGSRPNHTVKRDAPRAARPLP